MSVSIESKQKYDIDFGLPEEDTDYDCCTDHLMIIFTE